MFHASWICSLYIPSPWFLDGSFKLELKISNSNPTYTTGIYISSPLGSWMDPSIWNSKYPTPIPHTQQVYIYISSPLGSWMDPSSWNSKYQTPIPHTTGMNIYLQSTWFLDGSLELELKIPNSNPTYTTGIELETIFYIPFCLDASKF